MKRALVFSTAALAVAALLTGCVKQQNAGAGRAPTNATVAAGASVAEVASPADASSPAADAASAAADDASTLPAEPASNAATENASAATQPAGETPAPETPAEPAPAKPTDEASAAGENESAQAPAANNADTLAAVDPNANGKIEPGDWPMWGGTSYRNNTPLAENIPTEWEVGKFDRKTGEWNKEGAQNIKWVSNLGSQSYGNPVIASGRVFVGTNNTHGYLPRYPSDVDLGCLIAFDEMSGEFLWQHSSEKLPTGRTHDWPLQGICSTPVVEGERLWFTTSRGHVTCLDVQGFYDGEDDGPVQNELAKQFTIEAPAEAAKALDEGKLSDEVLQSLEQVKNKVEGEAQVKADEAGKRWSIAATVDGKERQFVARVEGPRLVVYKITTPDDKHEADVIWSLDMMKQLGVSQHNMCSCSPVAYGDLLFIITGNGVDETHINIPAPQAPSFICLDKNTGEVYWKDNSPGENIMHGQWSSPAVAELGGVPQAIFAGGDGYLYSFKADKGQDGKPELLWKFDANPKKSKYILGGRGTRNEIIATPVIYDGLVYLAVGQDPEHGEGEGHLWCLDPTKRGDISAELAVKVEGDKRIPLPHRRLQAVIEENGETAIDNPNSGVVWHYGKFDQDGDGEIAWEEEMHRSCGTVAIKDDLLYIADFSGLFHCVDAKSGKVHWTYDMLAASWASPLIVGDHVYISDEDGDVCVFNLTKEKHEPIAEINMGNSVYTTPVVANDVLYIANRTHVFAIAPEGETPEPAAE
jgi:outer membrane protein assembly factor BamB